MWNTCFWMEFLIHWNMIIAEILSCNKGHKKIIQNITFINGCKVTKVNGLFSDIKKYLHDISSIVYTFNLA